MTFPADQIEELKRLFPGAAGAEEGGCAYFLIPAAILPAGCSPAATDLLLCPGARDGYPSRLFLGERVQCPKKLNWNATGVRILERNWHAFSWKVNRAGLRLAQLVAAHLGALA